MEVLALSSVPVVRAPAGLGDGEIAAAYSPDPVSRRRLRDLIQSALSDLSDAGLAISAPSVRGVHPLARHISRSVVAYTFLRGEDYGLLQLREFQALAENANCVFRIGGGPWRNIDGENLQAPGREIKVPVHPQARNRRLLTVRELVRAGIDVDEELPAVAAEEETILRDRGEIIERMSAVAVIARTAQNLAAGAFTPADELMGGAADASGLTHREARFLRSVHRARAHAMDGGGAVPEQLRRQASHFHGARFVLEALAWVVGAVEVDPARVRAWEFDPGRWLSEADAELPRRILAHPAPIDGELRGLSDILEAFDLVHLLHHSIGSAAEMGNRPQLEWSEGEVPDMARAWVAALAWVCQPLAEWSQAPRLL